MTPAQPQHYAFKNQHNQVAVTRRPQTTLKRALISVDHFFTPDARPTHYKVLRLDYYRAAHPNTGARYNNAQRAALTDPHNPGWIMIPEDQRV